MEGLAVTPMDQWSHATIFAACILTSTLGGFAQLLRSDVAFTPRNFFGYLLWFGLAGMSTAMVGFKWIGGKEQPWAVIGISTFVGMGIVKTTTFVPWLIEMVKLSAKEKGNGDDRK